MLQSLLAFVGAAVVIALVPGPSTVMVLRQSLREGRRSGVASVLGNEAGVLLWGLAAAFGLSALLVASRLAYDGIRLAGAGVLVWFGVHALWQARRGPAREGAAAGPVAAGSVGRSFRLGVVTSLANPKAGVFAVSFLPQFVPDGAPVLPTLVLFSVLWALIDTVWYLGIVWLVGRVKGLLERPGVRRRLEQVSGVVLVGLGVRLAAETR
ncbi:LysE family translocator [Actinomadura scrupuli]|uniref:LysE family translocator n=1 Tax=Actinomadura scrupuli TaxID=559629 RepID=UPI003D95F894